MSYIDDHVALLKQQREEYQSKSHNFMLDAAFGALERVFKPDNTALVAQVDDLSTALAGQSADIAQIKQVLVMIAQSHQNLESGIGLIAQQTAPKVRQWVDLRKEINSLWNSIVDDVTFFNSDAKLLMVGRGVQSLFSFGAAAPGLVHQVKVETRNVVKTVKAQLERLVVLVDYCRDMHNEELTEYFSSAHVLKVEDRRWTINDAATDPAFHKKLEKKLLMMRGL